MPIFDFLTITKLEVEKVVELGTLSTGGSQLLGRIANGYLVSEPGFELQFNGTVKYASNFLTSDPGYDDVSRPGMTGAVYPDNGDIPFLIRIGGIERISQQEVEIITSNTSTGLSVPYGYAYSGEPSSYRACNSTKWFESVVTPTFYGGGANYSILQNSIFVGAETVGDGGRDGYFEVGVKISMVSPINTTITIGHEFP